MVLGIARAGRRLIAVGERGHVLLSDDDGRTWRQTASPTSVTLTAVRFATASEGWAVGHMGVILHTTDNGNSWQRQLDGIAAARLVLADAATTATPAGLRMARQLVDDGPDKPFLDLLVRPHDVLAVGAFGLAFASEDRGEHWVSQLAKLDNPQGLHIYGLASVRDDVFAVGERGLLLHSSDGRSFGALPMPYKGTLFGILPSADGALLVFGLHGTVLRSTDAGRHWTTRASGLTQSLTSGIVRANGEILLGCQSGRIAVSDDGGRSFARLIAVPEPVAALAESSDGGIIVAGPRGLVRLDDTARPVAR
jgi:photosystem II stability/assembly factor-like uncharacterized protein